MTLQDLARRKTLKFIVQRLVRSALLRLWIANENFSSKSVRPPADLILHNYARFDLRLSAMIYQTFGLDGWEVDKSRRAWYTLDDTK